MMMLKYSLSVFCFLLAGYSCVPGHKETKTSAKVETTCTDSICAGPGDISPEGTASDCISFAHADSIDADSIYTSPSQKMNPPAHWFQNIRKARWLFTWILWD